MRKTALLLLVFSTVVFADEQASFLEIQAQYFPMLNLRSNRVRLQKVPQFAAKLTALSQHLDGKNPSQDGLVLIYDSLMTTNSINAVLEGAIPLAAFREANSFAPVASDPQDELLARNKHAIENLEKAAKLRPEDRRIDSWIAAARSVGERLQNGSISKGNLKASLDAIPVRPTFNLWTSILLFKDEPNDSELFARLGDEAKAFIDGTRQGNDPCTKRPQDCLNGSLAPSNLQASVKVLGDVFLRRAEAYLTAGDVPHAMEMAGYARGTYEQLKSTKRAKETASWADHDALDDRLIWVGKIQRQEALPTSFVKSKSYRRVYECASCHGR